MATTIALHEETRARLARIQEAGGLPSMDAVVSALLDAPQHSATALWSRHRPEVTAVCGLFGIRRLTAFGSRVWGIPHPASDLDLVAEFEKAPGLLGFQEAEEALCRAFAVPVGLHTPGGLRPSLRRVVEERGQVLYD